MTLVAYALGASVPLLVGGVLGSAWRPPRPLVAHALALATGVLVASLAFELVAEAYRDGQPAAVMGAFGAGAVVFVLVDTLLERAQRPGGVGLALLAGVTLDGIPENAALGVTLAHGSGSLALLVGVVLSNLPEALAGSVAMRDNHSRGRIITIWAGATALLAAAVVVGQAVFAGADRATLALPVAFAGGAVLASVTDTLVPEAVATAGPWTALATCAGFVIGTALALG